MKVVVCERNKEVAEYLAMLLTVWGHEVVCANLSRTIELANSGEADVVSIAVTLTEVEEAVLAANLPVPFILTSSAITDDDHGSRARLIAAGAIAVLSKPFHIWEMRLALQEAQGRFMTHAFSYECGLWQEAILTTDAEGSMLGEYKIGVGFEVQHWSVLTQVTRESVDGRPSRRTSDSSCVYYVSWKDLKHRNAQLLSRHFLAALDMLEAE